MGLTKPVFNWKSAALLALMLPVMVLPVAMAREVSGKVVAVYSEPVNINNKWLDKVSVTVKSCSGNPMFETFSYSPGSVSDDNALGSLFNHLSMAARSMEQKNQFMNSVNGHVSLFVDDNSRVIHKTTFWGYNWECGRNLDRPGGGAMQPAGMAPTAQPSPSTGKQAPPAAPSFPGVPNPLRRFGF